MAFHILKLVEPRSNSIGLCPWALRCSMTRRVPVAPIAIFSRKLSSVLNDLGRGKPIVSSNDHTSTILRHFAESPLADLEDLARFGGVGRVGFCDAGVVQADAALFDEAAGF